MLDFYFLEIGVQNLFSYLQNGKIVHYLTSARGGGGVGIKWEFFDMLPHFYDTSATPLHPDPIAV